MARPLGLAFTSSTLSLCLLAGLAAGQNTDLASIRPNGVQANNYSQGAHVTPDGRFVAFYSLASTLVSGDTGGHNDVFVFDRKLNTMVRVSVPDPSMPDTQANGGSQLSRGQSRVMSDDGRFVIFASDADNLVPNDTNGVGDVFVRDRDLDGNGIFDEPGIGKTKTTRVSLSSNEGQGIGPCPNQICDHYSENGVISANGRYVAWQSNYGFTSENAPYMNVYWRDRDADNDGLFDEAGGSPDAAVTRLVSKRISTSFHGQTGDGYSQNPAISADGRWVAFESVSRYMVFSDSTANVEVFVRDMISNTQNIRITEPTSGGQPDADSGSATISGNGRFVAFASGANNLNSSVDPAYQNILIKDRDTDNDGIFDEAGAVAFINASIGRNPFVLPSGIVTLNNNSFRPSISDDGQFVAFDTPAGNFFCSTIGGCVDTNGVSDILVYDRLANRTSLASLRYDGAISSDDSTMGAISPNGRWVGFKSDDALLSPTSAGAPYTHAYVRAMYALTHDSCTNALPLPPVNLTYSGDTFGSSWSGDLLCASTYGSPAQWFSYTANCTGQLTIHTANSSYDTVLSVFNAPCPATANKGIACNDDFSGLGLQSQVTIHVTQGQTYIIRVSGWNFDAGFLQLHINACQPACVADLDDGSSTGTPDGGVTIDDLLYYLAIFEAGSINADVDDGSSTGTPDGGVTIDDLLYYLLRFEAGC
jgi:Tol biopolymer transport system component